MDNTDEKLNLIIANQEWAESVIRAIASRVLESPAVGDMLKANTHLNLTLKQADDARTKALSGS